jgi:hypothetical protein
MINAEKQYEYVCEQINARNQYIMEYFKTFLQLFSGIVGGSIWLSLTHQISHLSRGKLAILSTVLAVLVALVTIIIILANLRSWRGHRLAQARLDADNPEPWRIQPPRVLRSSVAEGAMMAAMVIAVIVFGVFNPFLLSN